MFMNQKDKQDRLIGDKQLLNQFKNQAKSVALGKGEKENQGLNGGTIEKEDGGENRLQENTDCEEMKDGLLDNQDYFEN